MRKHRSSVEVKDARHIVAAYSLGQSGMDLAQQYNVSHPTMINFLRNHGVQIRSRIEINRLRSPVDEKKLRKLVDEAVLSQKEIAGFFGVSLPTIERRLRQLGLKSKRGRGSPMEKNHFWNGGKTKDSDGYILVKTESHPFADNRGYVREHRLVMEKALGRFLDPKEIVHHKDTVHDNNDPDNLEVYATNGAHLRHELKGKTPNYTKEGLQRMRENALELNRHRYASSQKG